MASLLLDRRTSSFDEPHASPLVPNQLHGALHTVTNKSRSQQQCTDATARLKGLSLAAVSTVFQAVISVCAKSLGTLSHAASLQVCCVARTILRFVTLECCPWAFHFCAEVHLANHGASCTLFMFVQHAM